MKRCSLLVFVVVATLVPCARAALFLPVEPVKTSDTSVRLVSSDVNVTLDSLQDSSGYEWCARAGVTVASALSIHNLVQTNVVANERQFVATYSAIDPPVELKSIANATSGAGPIELSISITNKGKSPIDLPLQSTLQFRCR